MGISKTLGNIYIGIILLVALLGIFHNSAIAIRPKILKKFSYFLESRYFFCDEKSISVFFLSKKQQKEFSKNCYNSEMGGSKNLDDHSLNRIFNAL